MAGPFDFTGQNIEDSYQRVLQTDGTLIYNGTGSLFTLPSAFPYTGSARITGSLSVTGSFNLDGSSSMTGPLTVSFGNIVGGTAIYANGNTGHNNGRGLYAIGYAYGVQGTQTMVGNWNDQPNAAGVHGTGQIGVYGSGSVAGFSGPSAFFTTLTGLTRVGARSSTSLVQIRGTGVTNATTALLVENSNGSASLAVLDNGNVGIGGAAEASSAYKLRVHGGLWATSFEQLQVLNGSSGVGKIQYYDDGATLIMRVYGTHPSEAVKGILALDRQDINYTTLENSITHTASFYQDHPSFVIRSNNTAANSFYLQNYMYASGALFVTSQPAGGDTSFRFKPNASILSSPDVFVINTSGVQVTGSLNVSGSSTINGNLIVTGVIDGGTF
jgi:hypothetical protein